MPLSDVYRLSVECSYGGTDQIINVFNYVLASGQLVPDPEEIVDLWQAQVQQAYLDTISDVVRIEQLVCVPFEGPGGGYERTVGVNGSYTGSPLPSQVASIISWRTALRGRSYRGRTYLPSPSAGVFDENWVAGHLTNLGTFAAAAQQLDGAILPRYNLVVASKTLNDYNEVTTYLIPIHPGTVRRRRIGVGS